MNRFHLAQRHVRSAAASLLQADQVAPMRSDAEIAAEVEGNYRWNLAVNLLDGATFWFGISFISSSTIIPLFVSKLTTSPLLIGVVAVIAQGGWYVPQIFTANAIERLPRKKPVVIKLGLLLERLPVWLLVLAALLAGRFPTVALGVFFVGYCWRGFGGGVVAPAWQEMIARCFPVERRGRFMGTANFLGAAMGAAGAGVSTWFLTTFAFPLSFVYVFSIAGAAIAFSWVVLSLTREPAYPVTAPRQSNRQFLAQLPAIVRRDHNFRRFLAARSIMALGSMGTGFVTVAAVHRWQVSDGVVGVYTAAYWLGQTIGNLSLGFLADRFGNKLSLELGIAAAIIALAMAWLAPSPAWIYAVFVFLGINLSAVIGAGILVALEFPEPQRRPTYAGMTNTTVGMLSMAAPLLGAWLAGASYNWVFATSTFLNLAALLAMRLWVREPRWATAVRHQEPE
jgi:MFS family permease